MQHVVISTMDIHVHNFQKAFDSVNRDILWKLHAHALCCAYNDREYHQGFTVQWQTTREISDANRRKPVDHQEKASVGK